MARKKNAEDYRTGVPDPPLPPGTPPPMPHGVFPYRDILETFRKVEDLQIRLERVFTPLARRMEEISHRMEAISQRMDAPVNCRQDEIPTTRSAKDDTNHITLSHNG